MAPTTYELPGTPNIDPESSLEVMLKNGAHRIYEALIYQKKLPESAIRFAVANALDLLTRIETSVKVPHDQKEKKQQRPPTFFSSMEGARLEFFEDLDTKELAIETVPKPKKKNSRKQQASKKFEKEATKFINTFSNSEIEKSIATSVMSILKACEDFAGPVKDVLKLYQPLFAKLKLVYARTDSAALLEPRGCYSVWLALDQPLIMHDRERDENTMDTIG